MSGSDVETCVRVATVCFTHVSHRGHSHTRLTPRPLTHTSRLLGLGLGHDFSRGQNVEMCKLCLIVPFEVNMFILFSGGRVVGHLESVLAVYTIRTKVLGNLKFVWLKIFGPSSNT